MAKVETSSPGFERERKDRRDAHREGTVQDSRQDDSRDPHDNYLTTTKCMLLGAGPGHGSSAEACSGGRLAAAPASDGEHGLA